MNETLVKKQSKEKYTQKTPRGDDSKEHGDGATHSTIQLAEPERGTSKRGR